MLDLVIQWAPSGTRLDCVGRHLNYAAASGVETFTGPMTPKAFHALFGRNGLRAKLPFPIHPHMLRRGYALLHRAGTPIGSRISGGKTANLETNAARAVDHSLHIRRYGPIDL